MIVPLLVAAVEVPSTVRLVTFPRFRKVPPEIFVVVETVPQELIVTLDEEPDWFNVGTVPLTVSVPPETLAAVAIVFAETVPPD